MLTKTAVAGLAASALLASVAFAQSPSATTDRATTAAPAAASDTSSFKGNWRASKLVGLNVYNDSNESLGSINDLLTDKNGDIKGAVIGVGGFLGVGEHLVAVSFDKLKFVDEPVAYTGAANAPATGGKASRRRVRRPPAPRRPRLPGGQEESVVSGSRHAQRDKGSAEGDAGVQVLDRVRHRSCSNDFHKWPDGVIAARPLCFMDARWRNIRNGAAHPIHDARPDVRLYRGGSTSRPARHQRRTIWRRASTRSSS